MAGQPGRYDGVIEQARRIVEGWSPAKRDAARRMTAAQAGIEAPCPNRDGCDEAQTCLGYCRVPGPNAHRP